MPPEVSPCYPIPIVTPISQFLPREPPRSLLANQPPKYKYYRGTKKMMMITKKKLIPILIFTLSGFSILRLLKISTVSLFSSPPAVALPPTHPHTQGPSKSRSISSDSAATLTEKEFRLLSNLISLRAPCNLLIFGLEQKYLNLSRINAGGKTVFLEDNSEKLNKIEANYSNTRIYKVEYQTVAKDAYKLLKYARRNPACGLQHSRSGSLKNSSCPLALTRLPREVYKRKWDMVVVDGPRGDAPDAPGRMATIYTASLIARSGNVTDVVVHDVDRMIEKWFAWEFLCDENLVSSKGKLWNFRIIGKSNSTTFCPAKTILIE
ncbi:Glucuronoxylan 4-O-methyltransferase 2 [Camellia lanceoleosa]|uniref:Glucuronoxylan 4-O-methyltransferase 2 n=1 Tax=Camellia lanceoleosa TaxID=1840588 RepID=A0ACC0FB99_9ERIC|nr:Glucuronoxylan 4-O-methyltransferase 2 [Camellia lanceoleosa]